MRFKLGQRDHNDKRRSSHAHTEEDNVTPELSRSLKDSLDEFSASLRPENSASYADFKSVKSSSGRLGLPLSLCTHNRSVCAHDLSSTSQVLTFATVYGRDPANLQQPSSALTQSTIPSSNSASGGLAALLASLPSSLASFNSHAATSALPRDLPLIGQDRSLYDQIMNLPSPRVRLRCYHGPPPSG